MTENNANQKNLEQTQAAANDGLPTDIGKLGFGLMRLPRTGLKTRIDIEQTSKMVDMFLDAGFNYFDTAYVYPGSEPAAKKALVDRYPRDSYYLATKLNAFMLVRNEKGAKQEIYTSLKRTGAQYFDFYLLHGIMNNNYQKYEKYGLWDYVAKLKEEGVIRHYGFSFHAGPELLDQILTEHPDVEFVQLQLNYRDWNDPSVSSRANYEVARKHGKKIIVMEPLKGGKLINIPEAAKKEFQSVDSDAPIASWGLRFAASLDGVLTVLSGMSSVEQMAENLSFMKDFKPLNSEEIKAIARVQEILGHSAGIACTGCKYCTGQCPKGIPIPDIFSAENIKLERGNTAAAKQAYEKLRQAGPVADECIHCASCERACPQHLPIIKLLEQANADLSA